MDKPWDILPDWSIVGMNHYLVNGERLLYVAMKKGDRCIREQGSDDKYLWNRLWQKAQEIEKRSA